MYHSYINAYTSAFEVFDMLANKPERVFCYPGDRSAIVTTWTGEPLCKGLAFYGRKWRDNFGGERQSVSFTGLDGHRYHGTLYGTYIRAKRAR
jgi:hypothetical protein